jgi:small subunit ribosomal protein S7
MPRRAGKVVKRVIAPDARYGSVTAAKFINKIMLWGQKATAERIVYHALQSAGQQLNSNPAEVLDQAIENATPLLMVKPRRVGGATYQVPVEVPSDRGRSLAMKWLITSARNRSGKSMAEKLASELIDAVQGQGTTIKKRTDVHKMAESNRAFVHYRW